MSSLGHAGPAPYQPVAWPVLSGQIPPLADSSVTRYETGLSLTAGLPPGQTTVLLPGDDLAGRSVRALGGTGKTHLAAALATAHHENRLADLVVWISATGPDAIIGGYAQALRDIGGPAQEDGPEAAAAQFLAWLAATPRPWLVVLDGLRDAGALGDSWPRGPAGRVLVTTDVPETTAAAPSPRSVKVGAFSPREALSYLSMMLRADPDQRIGAVDLAGDLEFIPVMLAQAVAYIAEAGLDCRAYRARWAQRRSHPALASAGVDVPGMAATWWLSAELADQLPPAGLARRALALVAMLAPAGIPGALLTSQAACAYLTGRPEGYPADEAQARAVVHNLARAGLVTVDVRSAARTVLVHPTVQAFARQSLSTEEASGAARAAADAAAQIWLRRSVPPAVGQALRDCTATLREAAGGLLWQPGCHPVLIEAGRSLDASGLVRPAVRYWQGLLTTSRRVLGEDHPQTAQFSELLGSAYQASGLLDEAIGLYESTVSDREQALGSAHPQTVVARERLAGAYLAGEQAEGAVQLAQRTLADCEQELGPGHPDSLTAREKLAQCYLSAGQYAEAIAAFRQTLASREEVLGPRHPDTIGTRAVLASAYLESGQFKEAVAACKRTLADREQTLGNDHPDTIAARGSLAAAYRSAHKRKDALRLFERTLADSERVRGADHPDTIVARSELATAYESAGKHAYAVGQYERTVSDAERVMGPTHPFTIAARENLDAAARYAQSVLGIDLRTPGR